MDNIAQRLKAYTEAHPFDPGDSDCKTVMDQLFQAYQESHESDPPNIRDGFRELDALISSPINTCPVIVSLGWLIIFSS